MGTHKKDGLKKLSIFLCFMHKQKCWAGMDTVLAQPEKKRIRPECRIP